jgi:hypothetical protein
MQHWDANFNKVILSPEAEAALLTIRRLRGGMIVAVVGALPVFGAIIWLHLPEFVFSYVAIIWSAAWMILVIWYSYAKCPVCHKLFNMSGVFGPMNPITTECMHCGLSLYPIDLANHVDSSDTRE